MFATTFRLARATALAGLGAAIPALLLGGTCLAQSTCTNEITVPGSQAIDAWIHVNNQGNCDLSGGGYVKTNTQIRLDARAETDGACAWKGWSCWPCFCTMFYLERKYVARIPINYDRLTPGTEPSLNNYIGAIVSMGGVPLQVMDSRDAERTSGPWSDIVPFVASYDFKFKGELSMTQCNIGPATTDTKTIRVNALGCLPRFLGENIHLPAGPIEVMISDPTTPTLNTAVDVAINLWNGIYGWNRFTPVGSCSGPSCVQVQARRPPGNPLACGEVPPTLGGIVPAQVYINPDYNLDGNQWPQAAVNSTMAHEFGHLGGLDENPGCPVADSVMPPPPPTGCKDAAGYEPRVADLIAITQSVYGTFPKTVCQ